MIKILFFFIFINALSENCLGQYKYAIAVRNINGLPISGVAVKGTDFQSPGITDGEGEYLFEADKDSIQLIFSATGYLSEVIIAKPDRVLIVTLKSEENFSNELNVNVYARTTTVTDAAAAISVLDASAQSRTDQTSFVSAMNTVPGVKMDERSPGSYRISIRGNLLRSAFGVRNVKVYLNGLPFTDASGNTYFNSLAVNSVNKLQIIKGPGGSMYGAGTGGVMLLDHNPEKADRTLQITGGSFGLFTAAGTYRFNQKITKQSIALSHQQAMGYREQAEMRKDVVSYALIHRADKKNTINTNIIYSDLFYETPGGLTAAQVTVNPRQARPASGIFKGAAEQKAAFYLKHFYSSLSDEIKLSNNWKNFTGAYFSLTGFKNPTIRNYEQKRETGAGGRSVFEFNSGKYSGAFGGEYQSGFINTSTHGNRLGIRDTLQYHDKINVRQVNIFAQAGLELPGRLEFTAGISYNNFYYGFQRINMPGEIAESNFSPQFIPRISMLKKLGNIGSAFVSYTKGYSPPTIDEIHASDGKFNKELNAEKGTNYEFGIKTKRIKNILSADVSFYVFQLQKTIVSRRDASDAEFYLNAGNTKQTGIEYSVIYNPEIKHGSNISKLKLQVTGNNVNARFGEYQQGNVKYSGKRLTGTAPFIFSFMADVQSAVGLYTNLTYTFTDKIPLNDANSFFAKAYNLLFVKIGVEKKLAKALSADFFASLSKGFNKNYSLGNDLNAAGNRFFNPAALQSFTGGVKFSFGRL